MTDRSSRHGRPVAGLLLMLLATAGCVGGPALRAGTPAPAATPPPAATSTPATELPAGTPDPTAAPSLGRPSPRPALSIGQPAPGPTDLVRTDGAPFRLADEAGHPTILFFGYTHCPDVCPETIATLLEVAEARPATRIVFVTVDPERDTLEFLTQWVEYLPDDLVGVTGTPEAIRRAADAYGVQYARVDAGSRAGYAMAHTAFQYLVDGTGTLAAIYPFATPAETIVRDLDLLQ